MRILTDSQHIQGFKESVLLLNNARQNFSHISWSFRKKISSKNSVLVLSEIWSLFVNMLAPDDKYSVSVKASVPRNQFKCNYLKIKKYFLNFSLHFWNLHEIWNTLRKRWASKVICFWNYRLQKAVFLKYLKSAVSEHLWTANMIKGTKHCLNLQGSIFVIFCDDSERN